MLSRKLRKIIVSTRVKFFNKIHQYLLESQQETLIQQLKFCGEDCHFYFPFYIINPGNLEIGNGVSIGTYVHMWCQGGITIGNRVLIASHTAITSVTHNHSKADMRKDTIRQPVIIEDDVWIGAHAVILPGITIGKGAVIGANSVVTKDVAPYSIMIGSPAKVHKQREIKNDFSAINPIF
ncbi:MAG: acyltransferase [Scytolyngbya sp. HA4215-MV1]|jgi:acetyltransferase-like isoleucine patch superfamily enzyme|nr:acyltransferase [Scytolyngbya sp. HA4215-MV1]